VPDPPTKDAPGWPRIVCEEILYGNPYPEVSDTVRPLSKAVVPT
jgi:hypothetical protein